MATKKQETKTTKEKKEMKVNLFVEHFDRQVADKEMVATVKKAWTSAGNKISDIKTMELYIKPSEDSVYYVINKTETGKVPFSFHS